MIFGSRDRERLCCGWSRATVTAGQPLAAAEKPDRKGKCGDTRRAGRIVARVQRQYTASRPLTVRTYAYTGRSTERTTLYLPGYTRTEETGAPLRSAEMQTEWQPHVWDAWHCQLPLPCDHREAGCANADLQERGPPPRWHCAAAVTQLLKGISGCRNRSGAARNFRF